MINFYTSLAATNLNSVWLYLIYALVAGFVILQSVVYLVQALRRAKKINMDMDKVKKVITSSITFSILPSLGILIGIVTLIGAIGIPLPAVRLSIIGSQQYETLAVNTVARQFTDGGLESLIGNLTGKQYVTMATAMTFGIIWGPLFCLFFFKKMQAKMQGSAKKSGNWNNIVFGAVFVGMVLAFLSVSVAKVFVAPSYIGSYYSLIAVAIAASAMWVFDVLIKKYNQHWLENFSLAFSMLLGMGVVAIISFFVLKNNPVAGNITNDALINMAKCLLSL